MVMLVRPEHPQNAALSIEVTELGMVVFLHPAMRVLVAVSIIALQLFLLSYWEFSGSTWIDDRSEHPSNAHIPIDVTDLGMEMLVRPEHPENA